MNRKMLVTSLSLLLLSTTLIGGIWAQTYAPGVAEGDTFTYDMTGFWNSNDPSATIPQSFLELNETDYYEVRINGTSGAEVIAYSVWHFKNGSDVTSTLGIVNLETGVATSALLILAANLNANDRIHPTGQDTITINETVVRNYLGEDRETNHLMITYQDNGSSGTVDRYFDRETGMLVESREETLYVNPDMTIIVSWKIKETNVWGNPMEIPWLLIIPALIAIAVIIGVLFYIKKKRKRKKH
jgi:hypothetical protein